MSRGTEKGKGVDRRVDSRNRVATGAMGLRVTEAGETQVMRRRTGLRSLDHTLWCERF